MSLTIHGITASRAIRPLWVAAELGLTFEHVPTPYQGGATRTPAFLALNPNGHIPVVIDHRPEGEVVVWESMACALYLARHHGPADGASLTPATPREDAEALRWSLWTVNEVEKDALTVLMHRLAMPPISASPIWPMLPSAVCTCHCGCWSSTWRRSRRAARPTSPPSASPWPISVWPACSTGRAPRVS
jgi:glutathione S-transferase